MNHEPDIYPYHYLLGHIIEDCTTLKWYLEHVYHIKAIMLPKECLIEQLFSLIKVISGEHFNPLQNKKGQDILLS